MSATPWVCGNCRSINQPREGRCYHCRTPRELVEADPETLIVAGVGTSRAPEEIRPTAGYRTSAGPAFMTQLAVAAGLVVTVVSSVMGADLVGRVLDGEVAETDTSFAVVGVLGVLGLGLGAAALVFWSLWLSRVVANVPALGLGWPNVTPNQAIFESLIPVVNLYRVPAILRDVVNRLEPNGKGEAIIAAGWLGLVGGLLLPRALAFAIVFIAGSLEDFVTLRYVAGQLGLGLTIVGGIVLIYLIRWIETRMAERARGVEPATATAAAAGTSAAGPGASGATLEPPVAGSSAVDPPLPAAAGAWSAAETAGAPDATVPGSSLPPMAPASQPSGSATPALGAPPEPPAALSTAAPPTPAQPAPAQPPPADRPAPPVQPSPAAAAPSSPGPASAAQPGPRPSLAPTAHWTQAIPNRGTLPSLEPRPAPPTDEPAPPDVPAPDAPPSAPRHPDT
jgi:hypothetical protein